MGNVKGGLKKESKPKMQLEGIERKNEEVPGVKSETNRQPTRGAETMGETENYCTQEGYNRADEDWDKAEQNTTGGEGTYQTGADLRANHDMAKNYCAKPEERTSVKSKTESERLPYVPRGLIWDSKSEDLIPNERASQRSSTALNAAYNPKGLVYDSKEAGLVTEGGPEDNHDNQVEGDGNYKPKGLVFDHTVNEMIPDDQPRFSLKKVKLAEVSNVV